MVRKKFLPHLPLIYGNMSTYEREIIEGVWAPATLHDERPIWALFLLSKNTCKGIS